MKTRLRTVAVLVLTGLACLFGPGSVLAEPDSHTKKEEAKAAKKREEILQTQITYASIAGVVIAIFVVIFVSLNSANNRRKTLANSHKRKRPLDPDAPLEMDVQAAAEPAPVE